MRPISLLLFPSLLLIFKWCGSVHQIPSSYAVHLLLVLSLPVKHACHVEMTCFPRHDAQAVKLSVRNFPFFFSICSLWFSSCPLPSSYSQHPLMFGLSSLLLPPAISHHLLSMSHRLALSIIVSPTSHCKMCSCYVADSWDEVKPNVAGNSSWCCFPRICWNRTIIFLHLYPGKCNWQLMRSITEVDKRSPVNHPKWLILFLAC